MQTSSDEIFLEDIMLQVATEARPTERMTVSEAAAKYITINQPGSFVGKFDPDYTPYMREPTDTLASREFTGMFFVGPVQTGKALALDTPILTFSGWKTMGALKVGDLVFSPSGEPVKVVFATEVQFNRKCYEITFSDGEKIVADSDHRWVVEQPESRIGFTVLTTKELLEKPIRSRKNFRYWLPPVSPLETRNRNPLWVEPYLLGYWLGDGCRQSGYITVGRKDLAEFRKQMESRGHALHSVKSPSNRAPRFRVVPGNNTKALVEQLRLVGLRENFRTSIKRIPEDYLMASPHHRAELLRGLMDSDGYSVKGSRSCELSLSEEALAEDAFWLIQSLGFTPKMTCNKSVLKGEQKRDRYRIKFATEDSSEVFSFARKIEASASASKRMKLRQMTQKAITGIRTVESVPVRCIQVSGTSQTFLAGKNLIPTHNTQMIQSWLTYSLKVEPADLMTVTMTKAAATDFTVSRIDRFHRNNPDLGKMLLPGSSSDSMYRKMYRNGMIFTVTWPTPTELASKSIPRVILTDYDRMPQDVGGEGSPFDLAEKRTTTFRRNAMCVAESTPSFPINDPRWSPNPDRPHEAPPCDGIIGLYNRGDRRRWLWRCISCHEAFEPDFSNLKWPDTDDLMEAAEAACMVCPSCGQIYEHGGSDDAPGKNEMNLEHARWVRAGLKWQPDGSLSGKPLRSRYASFWLKGPAARFQTWEKIVFDYLMALRHYERTGDETQLQVAVNTQQALPYRPQKAESLRSPEELQARARDLGNKVVPPGVRFLIATVDVQKNRFVVQVQGVGEGGDKWIVDRFNIRKSVRENKEVGGFQYIKPGSYAEDWNLLVDQVILKTYPLSDDSGRHMPIKLTLCDSGGQAGVTKHAYDFWRRLKYPPKWDDDLPETHIDLPPGLHTRFQLLIGRPKVGAPRYKIAYPDSERKDRHAGARGDIPVAMLHTDMLKNELDHALDRTEPRGGRINFPDWLDADFFNELCAEVKNDKGAWEKVGTFRNESWDLLAYCIGACLDSRIGIERTDFWIDPPSWAAPWDENDFIFHPDTGKSMVEGPSRAKVDFKKLGSELA